MAQLPNRNEYSQAVQNPHLNFADAELQSSKSHKTPLGLPVAWSGGAAIVFQLRSAKSVWAVRCFIRQGDNRQERYQAFEHHLHQQGSLPYLVSFTYLEKGIRVNGNWYPIVKMPWVESSQLDEHIYQLVQKKATNQLSSLAQQFLQLVIDLERRQIEHGDLQHGNVLVRSQNSTPFVLVDYDGIYVPRLKGWGGIEIGHRHYQHPKRAGKDFGPQIDRFSSLVIYLSLLALSKDISLWSRFHRDEYLILADFDYKFPHTSPALNALLKSSDKQIQALTSFLIEACNASPQQLLSLSEYLSKTLRYQSTTPAIPKTKTPNKKPKYKYPPTITSTKLIGQRHPVVLSNGQCTNPTCRKTLISVYYHLPIIDKLVSEEAPFCSQICIDNFLEQKFCTHCIQPLADKYWSNSDLDRAFGKKRFCTEKCLSDFQQQRACAECNQPLGEQYWQAKDITTCYGYEKRFCSHKCINLFRNKHLCRNCSGALLSTIWTNKIVDQVCGDHLLFCSDECATQFKDETICLECNKKLSPTYWYNGHINSSLGRDVRFCSEGCLESYNRQHQCAQCQIQLDKFWHYSDLTQLSGYQVRFCSESCGITFRRDRLCLQCGQLISVKNNTITYYSNEMVDKKIGYKGRFCSDSCAKQYTLNLSKI